MRKDKRIILKKEKLKEEKKEKVVRVRKIEEGKLLREITVKIQLKQKDDKKEIVVKALLNSNIIVLMISSKFARKNKFKKKKLDRLIYIRNIDNILNHKRLIEHIVKIELFYRGHKEKIEIDVIKDQKYNIENAIANML